MSYLKQHYLIFSLTQAVLFSFLAILFDLSKPDITILFMTTLNCNLSPGRVKEIIFLQWPGYMSYLSFVELKL